MEPNQKFTEKLIHKYERYVAPFTFILGFVFDTLTLKRIDLWAENAILIGYLGIVVLCMALINMSVTARRRLYLPDFTPDFAAIAMQFGLGGLFSAFVIFYTKSAAFAQSWVFLAALAVIFIGNELLRKKYERLVFQFGILFVAVFSYAVFLVPLIVGKIGDAVFIMSGALSLGIIATFVFLMKFISGARVEQSKGGILITVGSIYVVFNIFYFLNVIPPAPLSLKESGVYHSVSRVGLDEYELTYEKAPWYLFFGDTDSVYRWRRGEPVYFWSAVFAPANFNIPIIHRWSRYNTIAGKWVELESIGFPIRGGRDGGYRGYSFKTGVEVGKWRVEVATESGAVLGSYTFEIVEAETGPQVVRTFK